MKKRNAFTLAEVLITLGVIGIVAAMTLPTLVQKQQEKVTITKLKKAYSILSQAMMSAVNENGPVNTWNIYTYDSAGDSVESGGDKEGTISRYESYNLIKQLKIAKDCKYKSEGCFILNGYKRLDGLAERNFENLNNQYYKLILADGMALAIEGYTPDDGDEKSKYGEIWVDVNGNKNPNIVGKDLFLFFYTKDRIYPYNYQKNNVPLANTECRLNSSGYDCAAWVLANENMEYLRCNDLSWTGKTKCK